ncbi:MAG: hypothetical protein ABSB91_10150, partial [Sedimentisphaerales bacterium]
MSEQFEKVGGGLLVRAPGKINISLLVKGKRADGFHDIESIMAKIDWYDEIVIERDTRYLILDSRKKETQIELVCKGEYKVPEGEENLVYKAARMILDFVSPKRDSAKGFGLRIGDLKRDCFASLAMTEDGKRRTENRGRIVGGIRLTLTKNMPAGSGLGSGSSDAAATLLGLNKFFRMGLGKKELAGLAAKLGSDVAFFLDGPIAFCTGRGEKVKKLEE